jgi:phosphatidate cytidylyltransferase
MLKKRLITAIILIPLFVLLLLKASPRVFADVIIAFLLIGAWEWSGLMGLTRKWVRAVYCLLILTCIFALAPFLQPLLIVTPVFWLLATLLVACYPLGSKLWGKSILVRGLLGILIFIPTFYSLGLLRNSDLFGAPAGRYILLFLFVLIWCADSGAYFAGKLWGKNKLAPRVSPGKTWQGLAGALLVTALLSPLLYYLFPAPQPPLWIMVPLCLVTILFSVVGDLFESMLKRNVGLKDSGTLFPGHGGLLDRIDSLTAAAPVFTVGCFLILKFFH